MKKDDHSERILSRRNFLKAMGSAAVVAAVGGMAVRAPGAEAACMELPKRWDETYDVVVIGSGFAGLAAAIEAKNAGAKDVVVIEKTPVHGGNSVINGGDFCAPGTRLQKENGVEDNPELLLQDMLRPGLYLNSPELAKTVAYNAKDALEWTESYLGCKYVKLNFHGGHSVKRAHGTINQSGSEVVNKEMAKASEVGV
ncbi:MAG TPA: FAD-dependent oxidoreductase, partial [Candidatus Omnitrophota bacterium]|nr:FAD-dependent oxidoreductase [Candidatus Omnitrophota bacterium]